MMGLQMRRSFINLTMEGVSETAAAMREIGKDVTIRAAMRRELRRAALPTLQMAKNNAPVEKGWMKEGIVLTGTLARRQRRGGKYARPTDRNTVNLFLGTKPRGPGVLAEFGTGPRYTKKGKFTGAAPAQPFLRPAWESDKYNVLDRFSRAIGPSLEKAARRAARRRAKGK